MCLEAWRDMFHIAVQAKLRVNIGELLDSREPEYIEPRLQDPMEDETADQKKKRDANNEKALLKAMKDHEENGTTRSLGALSDPRRMDKSSQCST